MLADAERQADTGPALVEELALEGHIDEAALLDIIGELGVTAFTGSEVRSRQRYVGSSIDVVVLIFVSIRFRQAAQHRAGKRALVLRLVTSSFIYPTFCIAGVAHRQETEPAEAQLRAGDKHIVGLSRLHVERIAHVSLRRYGVAAVLELQNLQRTVDAVVLLAAICNLVFPPSFNGLSVLRIFPEVAQAVSILSFLGEGEGVVFSEYGIIVPSYAEHTLCIVVLVRVCVARIFVGCCSWQILVHTAPGVVTVFKFYVLSCLVDDVHSTAAESVGLLVLRVVAILLSYCLLQTFDVGGCQVAHTVLKDVDKELPALLGFKLQVCAAYRYVERVVLS